MIRVRPYNRRNKQRSSRQNLPGIQVPYHSPESLHPASDHQQVFQRQTMQVAKKSGIRLDSTVAITGDAAATTAAVELGSPYETVRKLAACNAVVVFSMSGCCMCTVAKQLLFGLGVGPTVIELDEHAAGPDIQAVLYELCPDGQQPIPAVFVGGKFLGGVETLMACHINGTLVPLLKDAGALWL